MKSRNIVFPRARRGRGQAGRRCRPGPGEVLCRAVLSLVSLGTEGHCLRGVYDPGTYWEEYIQYPFHPGYSMAAQVVGVGEGVTRHKIGDRVTSWAPHSEYFLSPEDQLFADSRRDPGRRGDLGDAGPHDADRRPAGRAGARRDRRSRRARHPRPARHPISGLSGARRVIVIDTVAEAARPRAGERRDARDLPAGGRGTRGGGATSPAASMADVVFDITGHPAVLAPGQPAAAQAGPAGAARRQPDAVAPEPRPADRRQLDLDPRHPRHDVPGRPRRSTNGPPKR